MTSRLRLVMSSLLIVCVLAACAPAPTLSPTALPTSAPTSIPPSATPIPPTATPTAPIAASASPTPAADPMAEIENYLNEITGLKVFSGEVLLAKDGKIVLSKAYGLADQDKKTPNTPQTRFLINSITKQFTAMAILMLQNEGKLSVQDPLCSYLKSCPEAWKAITIRQLLTHTSGMPDFSTFTDPTEKYANPMTPDQLVDWFSGKALDFPPGEKFSYSSVGYDLLGNVIEKASGQAYGTYLKEAIFDPLHMQDTGYDPKVNDLATGYKDYSRDERGYVTFDLSIAYAGAGLYSTTDDLYKWDQALYTEKLLPQAQLAEMFKSQVITNPGSGGIDVGYGYGWYMMKYKEHRLVFHEGYGPGFVSAIIRFPDDAITFIILSNNELASLDVIDNYIVNKVIE